MHTAVCHPGALDRHLLPVSDSKLNASQRAWAAFSCTQIQSATGHYLHQAVHEQAGNEQKPKIRLLLSALGSIAMACRCMQMR